MRTSLALFSASLSLCSVSLAWPQRGGGKAGGGRGGSGGLAKLASPALAAQEEGPTSLLDLLEGVEERTVARAREAPLAHLSSNPSCFLRALSFLPSPSPSSTSSSTCPTSSPCDVLSQSDTARAELAVRMALCEIRTGEDEEEERGRGKIPRECEEWEGSGGQKSGKGKGGGKVGGCVEALSRSPQYWSSYSGYLREIVTLCSTLSRWSDLSLARDLHRETSLVMREWMGEVRVFERERGKREGEAEGRRVEVDKHLATALSSLSALHTSLTSTSSALSSSVDSTASSLSLLVSNLATQLEAFEAGMRRAMETMGREMDELVVGMDEGLKGSLQAHGSSLSALATLASARLASSLDLLDARQAGLAKRMIDLSLTVQGVDAKLRGVNSALLDLEPFVSTLSLSLSGSLSSASSLDTQLQTLHSSSLAQASHLHAVLANLTRLAEEQQAGLFNRLSVGGGGWGVGGYRLGVEDLVWVVQLVWSILRSRLNLFSLTTYLLVYFSASSGFSSSPVLPIVLALFLYFFRGGTSRFVRFPSFPFHHRRTSSFSPTLPPTPFPKPATPSRRSGRFALPSFSPSSPSVRRPVPSSSLSALAPLLAATTLGAHDDEGSDDDSATEEAAEARRRRFTRAQSAPL